MTASKQAQGLKSFPPEGGGFYQKGDYKYKADTEEWYLRYDIDSERRFSKKLKMMSAVHDGQFYQTELAKKPQRIVACLGISQYFDGPEVSPENKGYYLNCNEVYFSV
jgi:hypothetical protein